METNENQLTRCTLCNSENVFLEISCTDYLTSIDGVWNYFRCSNCDYIFLNPPLKDDQLKSLYNSSEHKLHYHQETLVFKKMSLFDNLKNKYKLLSFKHTLNNSEQRSRLKAIIGLPVKGILMRNLEPVNTTTNSNILEIGAGNGERLARLVDLGYRSIFSNEFNLTLAKILQERHGITVWSEDIRNIPALDKIRFDFIVSSMTLEHVENPSTFIRKIHEILNDKGTFCFSVPNYDCLETRLFGEATFGLQPPYHVSQFTEKSLRFLLKDFKDIQFYYQLTDRDWVSSARRVFKKNPSILNFLLNIGSIKIIRATLFKTFLLIIFPLRRTGRVTVYAKK